MAQCLGVVLAGGAGRRLGRDKATLDAGDGPLARRAADVLWTLCPEVLISIGPEGPSPVPGRPVVRDAPPGGRGPLAGLAAAFAASGSADLLVLACDYPRVDADLLARVLDAARPGDDVVIPTDPSGRDHPLVGLWRRRVAGEVADAVERGALKVRSLLAGFAVRRLDPASFPGLDLGDALLNVNVPADLERVRHGAPRARRRPG